MGEGLQFARLVTLIGKKHGARWQGRRVTLGACGINAGGRWLMGTMSDGTVVVGPPEDFTVPEKRKSKVFCG
jgi:hypothetical protein